MNHVLTILLVFGAGLACGLWAMWLLMRAGERNARINYAALQVAADKLADDVVRYEALDRATVYDSTESGGYYYWCSKCNVVFDSLPIGRNAACNCLTDNGSRGSDNPSKWQRVRVTARRLEQ